MGRQKEKIVNLCHRYSCHRHSNSSIHAPGIYAPGIVNPKAFTLIELLVVISIITLLMAILLPTLQRVNRQAKAVTCQANLKQWGTVLALYLEDNEGRFPGNSYSTIWILTGQSFGMANPTDPKEFQPIRTKGMLCPMAAKSGAGEYSGFGHYYEDPSGVLFGLKVYFGSTFRAWELTEPGTPICVSYGLNTRLFGISSMTSTGNFGSEESRYTDIFSMRRTAGIPLLFDCITPDGSGSYNQPPPEYEGWKKGSMWRFCINRHNGHINSLFMDWSVRKVGLKELWTLKWSPDFDTANVWTRAGGVKPEEWPEWMRGFKDY
jgi:prepilin-type N-terminal cleavage/methylation domain-containing protein/prepilin-type processing-associated H-X9-DG protein